MKARKLSLIVSACLLAGGVHGVEECVDERGRVTFAVGSCDQPSANQHRTARPVDAWTSPLPGLDRAALPSAAVTVDATTPAAAPASWVQVYRLSSPRPLPDPQAQPTRKLTTQVAEGDDPPSLATANPQAVTTGSETLAKNRSATSAVSPQAELPEAVDATTAATTWTNRPLPVPVEVFALTTPPPLPAPTATAPTPATLADAPAPPAAASTLAAVDAPPSEQQRSSPSLLDDRHPLVMTLALQGADGRPPDEALLLPCRQLRRLGEELLRAAIREVPYSAVTTAIGIDDTVHPALIRVMDYAYTLRTMVGNYSKDEVGDLLHRGCLNGGFTPLPPIDVITNAAHEVRNLSLYQAVAATETTTHMTSARR